MPNTWTFTFDVETPQDEWSTVRGPRMLSWIYGQHNESPNMWSAWKVPGSVGWLPCTDHASASGQTLDEMFEAKFGTNATPTLNPGVPGEEDVNLPEMVWWHSVMVGARCALMWNCAYSVLESRYPGVRYGNFDEATYDRQAKSTSPYATWFRDKANLTPSYDPYPATAWPTLPLTQTLPRAWFDRQGSFAMMNAGQGADRWLGVSMWTGANCDSPALYPISDNQWSGSYALGQRRGWWQSSPYVPAALQYPAMPESARYWFDRPAGDPTWSSVEESRAYARVALDRHTLESMHESLAAAGVSLTDRLNRVDPWGPQSIVWNTTMPDDPQSQFFNKETEVRLEYLMFRALGIKQFIAFQPDPENTPNVEITREVSWNATRSLVDRVWGPYIEKFRTDFGINQSPTDEDGWSQDGSPLETTLPDVNGNPNVAMVGHGSTGGPHWGRLVVDMSFPDQNWAFPPEAGPPDYEVIVEAIGTKNTIGHLEVRDWNVTDETSRLAWRQVPTIEGAMEYTFAIEGLSPAPDQVAVRRRFRIRACSGNIDVLAFDSGTERYRMQLRFVHSNAGPATSAFDLVQVCKVKYIPSSVCDETRYLPPAIKSGTGGAPIFAVDCDLTSPDCNLTSPPPMLNSRFLHIHAPRPDCGGQPTYADQSIALVFDGPIAAEDPEVPPFVCYADGNTSTDYSPWMQWWIDARTLTIWGDPGQQVQFVEGTYRVYPREDAGAHLLCVSEMFDDPTPVDWFEYAFALQADCNRNGVYDATDILNGWPDTIVPYDIPDCCHGYPVCDPDYNQDGMADQGDIEYLSDVIAGGSNPTERDPDYNQNGMADQDDVAALINTVSGGGCP